MKRWACALWLATLTHPAAAAAADSVEPPDAHSRTVVLLRSRASDDVTTEATARVDGELGAAGFPGGILAPSGDGAGRAPATPRRALPARAPLPPLLHPSRRAAA